MDKNWDIPLQIVFVLAMILLGVVFYLTRLMPLKADNSANKPVDTYANFNSVFQFEQEELRIETQIRALKADYASNLVVYLEQRNNIIQSEELSELEKREKLAILDQVYGADYFQRKTELIDEQKLKLENLLHQKCLKFCSYQDLPNGA